MRSLIKYVKDTRAEMKHVAWPTQQQTSIYTALVVAVSLLTAAYLGFFDFLFTQTLESTLEVLPGGGQTQQVLPNGTTTPGASDTGIPTDIDFETTGGEQNGGSLEIDAESEVSSEAPASGEQTETGN